MRTLACKDIGIPHCDFVASGETVHEVLEQMIDHIEVRHLAEWGHREEGMNVEAEKDFLIRHIKDNDGSPI